MTLSAIEGHSLTASLFKCDSSYLWRAEFLVFFHYTIPRYLLQAAAADITTVPWEGMHHILNCNFTKYCPI